MHNQRDEQVIFIKDLLFAALYRWRVILIAAIVAAMLLGGFTAITGLGSLDSTEPPADTAQATTLRDNIRRQSEYLENSVLMNIDPHHAGKATANISILAESFSAEGSDALASYVGTLLSGYASAISNCISSEDAATALGLTTADLLDLVMVSTTVHGPADGTLSIQVYHGELEKAEQILTYILEAIPATTEMLKSTVANHTTNIITASGVRLDMALLERQTKVLKTLDDMRTALNKLPSPGIVGASNFSHKDLLKKSVLMGIIGAVLGAGGVVCAIWVAHFSSTKVYSARTLTAWTGIKVLGCVEGTSPKCAIDRWLRKLEGRANENALPVTATIVANYAAESTDFLICADSACPDTVQKTFSQKISTAKLCGTVTEDITAAEALPECGAVLLIAVCGKTRYSDIARQMQLIRDQGKPLVGCVVIDG